MTKEYKEHTMPSGEIISMDMINNHPTKPWNVSCWMPDGEQRWSIDFATREEAEKEYIRFD